MKYLKDSVLEKFVTTSNLYDARVLHIPAQLLTTVTRDPEEPYVYEDVILLSLPQNCLKPSEFNAIWQSFPSTWWLDVSQNQLHNFDAVTLFPPAVGLLDLRGNNMVIKQFPSLAKMYILRLFVENSCFDNLASAGNAVWDGLLTAAGNLPFTWVYNDEFISCLDRTIAFNGGFKRYDHTDNVDGAVLASSWRVLAMNQRQATILQVVHDIQRMNTRSDQVKLDILLEDYIQYGMIFNEYVRQLAIANNAAVKHIKPIPLLSNIDLLLYIPHRQRLDLSVLLTIAIMFPIPTALLRDALTILLVSHCSAADVDALVALPNYIKTAIVSLIGRITKREFDEIHANKCLKIKPQRSAAEISQWMERGTHALPVPTCGSHPADFYYLRVVKEYLHMNYARSNDGSNDNTFVPSNQTIFFSELELELMQKLPSCPTKHCGMKEIPTTATDPKTYDIFTHVPMYHAWVSFAARHAIFLLNKAPSCPSLTKLSTNLTQQDLYFDLLPLLKAANMSLVDLDVSTTGPLLDGRAIQDPLKATKMATGDGKKKSKYAKRMESAMVLLDGKVLPHGVGLPNASTKTLLWHAEPESELAKLAAEKYQHNTAKPWQRRSAAVQQSPESPLPRTAMTDTMSDTAAGGTAPQDGAVSFFVTEEDLDQGEIHRAGSQSKIRLIPSRGKPAVYQLSSDGVGVANYFGERVWTREMDPRPLSPTILPSPSIRPPSPIQLGTAGFTSQYSSLWTGSKDDVAIMTAPELFPPEFRPHSRLGSAKNILNHTGSNDDGRYRSRSSFEGSHADFERLEIRHEDQPPSRAFTPQPTGSIAGRSQVSISLPSVQTNSPEASLDGRSVGGSSVAPTGMDDFVSASILSKNDEEEDDDADLIFQPHSTSQLNAAPAMREDGSKLLTLESAASSLMLLALGKDSLKSSKSIKGDDFILDDESNNGDVLLNNNNSPARTPMTPAKPSVNFVSPQKTLNSVQIYSADTLPKTQFLVAPPRAVESFNVAYGLSTTGTVAMEAESMDNYWRSLDKPPVMLLSNVISPLRTASPSNRAVANNLNSNFYVSPESFKKGKTLLAVTGSGQKLNTSNVRSQPSSPQQAHLWQENAFGEAMLDEQSISSEITSSIMLAKENSFMEFGGVDEDDENVDVLHNEEDDHLTRQDVIRVIREKEMEELGLHGFGEAKRITPAPSKKRLQIVDPAEMKEATAVVVASTPAGATTNATFVKQESFKPAPEVSAEEAAMELLRDMGTLRNVKQLQRFNQYLTSIRFDGNGKAVTVAAGTSKKDTTTTTTPLHPKEDDISLSDDMSSIHMSVAPSPVINRSFLAGSQQLRSKQTLNNKQADITANNEANDTAFLTAVTDACQDPPTNPTTNLAEEDSDGIPFPGNTATVNEMYTSSNPYATIVQQSNRIPTETIREQKNYPHIYTNERFEDKATYSYISNVKVGSDAFYPVFHKNMYKMEVPPDAKVPEHLLEYASRPVSTRPLSSKPIHAPTLLENSILSATPTYLDDEINAQYQNRHSRPPTGNVQPVVPPKAVAVHMQSNSTQLKHNLKILQSSSRFFKELISKESFEVPMVINPATTKTTLRDLEDEDEDEDEGTAFPFLASSGSGVLHQNYGDQMHALPLPSIHAATPPVGVEDMLHLHIHQQPPSQLTSDELGGMPDFDDELSHGNSVSKSGNGESVLVMPARMSVEMRDKHGKHQGSSNSTRPGPQKAFNSNKPVNNNGLQASKAGKDKTRQAVTNGLIITNGSNQIPTKPAEDELATPRTASTFSTNQIDSLAIYEAYNSHITQENSLISNYSNSSFLSHSPKKAKTTGKSKPLLRTSATELELLRRKQQSASDGLQINTMSTELNLADMLLPSSKPNSPNAHAMKTSRSQKSLTSQHHNAFSIAAKQLINSSKVGQNCKYLNPVAPVRQSSTSALGPQQESDEYKRLFMPNPAVDPNDPHRRLFALSASVGSDSRVWVGMQNYKAMTHSVALNRNFKAKVVPASVKLEQNGEE